MKGYCFAPQIVIHEKYPDGTPPQRMPFALPFTVFSCKVLGECKQDGSVEIALDGVQIGKDGKYYDVDYTLRFANATVLQQGEGYGIIVTNNDGCEIVLSRIQGSY